MKIKTKNIKYNKHVGKKLQITKKMKSNLILVEYKTYDSSLDYKNSLPSVFPLKTAKISSLVENG